MVIMVMIIIIFAFSNALLESSLIAQLKNVNAPALMVYSLNLQQACVFQVVLLELLQIFQQKVAQQAALMDI